jgi:hypothetical protein
VPLRIAVIGNFNWPWTTANDLTDTLQRMGIIAEGVNESDDDAWNCLLGRIKGEGRPDAVIWNRTPAHTAKIGLTLQATLLYQAEKAGIPTIAYHLDRWWGLKREYELRTEPFFRCNYVFTADGHDQDRWERLGINHFWLPPAIAPRHAFQAVSEPRYRAKVAFIGTQYGYHPEWKHRDELVRWLKRYYGKDILFIPNRSMGSIRGTKLNSVIASVKVVVGDSCLAPVDDMPYARYCSDRLFEVPGRGGFLMHPLVASVVEPSSRGSLMVEQVHVGGFELGDFQGMKRTIDHYAAHDDERKAIATQGYEHVLENHTYINRLDYVLRETGLR